MDAKTARGAMLAATLVAATLAGVAPAAAQQCSFPVSETDATGTEVTIQEEPGRIVTLSPSAAQTMWEIGGKDKVVGVTKYASYLEGADEKTNVSGAGRTAVVIEKVVALNPDLVLAPNIIPPETVEKLRESGLTVYRFREATSVDDVKAKTRLIGRLTGECAGAEETVDWMDSELSVVREAVEGEDRPRVLYVFFGFTAGEDTFIDHMIELAGGTNVAAEANITGFKQISDEVVADQDPEWIVLNSDDPTVPKRAAYNQSTAVQENNVLVLNANLISQPTPRVVVPIRTMAKAFHPEAYAVANTTVMPSSPTVTSPTEPETTAPGTPTTTETTSPGFGVGPALVALVAALWLARR